MPQVAARSEGSAARRAAVTPLPELGTERLSELLGLIYEAALQPETWAAALSAIRVAFDANFVSLIVRPGSGDDLGLIVSAAPCSPTP